MTDGPDTPEQLAALPPVERLLRVMAWLRDPEHGCPWDIQQDFGTIAPYTIEEAYEVAEAIRRGDMGSLREELGDLLLQVAYHARMAEEAGHFDFATVAGAIADKMIERHPHVFGSDSVESAAAQTERWEERKARERAAKAAKAGNDGSVSVLDDVALALPALMRAEKLQKRAARIGFDWPDAAPVYDKLAEEIAELRAETAHERQAEEVGDLLFATVNLARHLQVDPESALRDANAKFERRFRHIEAGLEAAGETAEAVGLDRLEALWNEAKALEKPAKDDQGDPET